MLTEADYRYLLQLIAEKHGFGYSKEEITIDTSAGKAVCKVGVLQAGLSVMMEASARLGKHGR